MAPFLSRFSSPEPQVTIPTQPATANELVHSLLSSHMTPKLGPLGSKISAHKDMSRSSSSLTLVSLRRSTRQIDVTL